MSLRSWSTTLAFAFGALVRRGTRTLWLFVGTVLVSAELYALVFTVGALEAQAESSLSAMPDVVVQRMVGGRPAAIDSKLADRLGEISGVRTVRPRIWGYVYVPPIERNVVVIGVEGEPRARLGGALVGGRVFGESEQGVVLSESLARWLALRVGDTWKPVEGARALEVVGLVDSRADWIAADAVYMSSREARALLALDEAMVTDIALGLANAAEAPIVRDKVERSLGRSVRIVERGSALRATRLAYGRRSGLAVLALVPALTVLLLLGWVSLVAGTPEERREMAIWRASGWSIAEVMREKSLEAVLLVGAATSVGLALAYAWVFLWNAPGLSEALGGWTAILARRPLTPAFGVLEVAGVALAVIAPIVGLSVLPAWRAAVRDPMHALRDG